MIFSHVLYQLSYPAMCTAAVDDRDVRLLS
jgi:hypothetical protein